MKVWIVEYSWFEESEFFGVYDDINLAKDRRRQMGKYYPLKDIVVLEYEINKPYLYGLEHNYD